MPPSLRDTRRWLPAAGAVLLIGCAATAADRTAAPVPAAPGAPQRPVDPPSRPAEPPEAGAWQEALRRSAAGGGWDALHLFVECRRDSGALVSFELFDGGVAIWDRQRQFELAEEQIRQLLTTLHDAGFAALQPVYGGRPAAPPAEGESSATQVVCRIQVRLDGLDKQSVQLAKGEQSPVLWPLGLELLARVEGPGASGVGAASLADGLHKIARGALAPEALRLLLHRRPERPNEAGSGFLLRVDGRTATSRRFEAGSGLGDPTPLELTPAEVAELAAELADADPGDLPINLYAPLYTDLTVEVLNHRASVQARRFAGMSADTHGESQQRFDRITRLLERLQQRAASATRPG